MDIAIGANVLDQLFAIRTECNREGIKVSNEIADAEASRQREEEIHQRELRITKLEETLEAAEIQSKSFLGGFGFGLGPLLGEIGFSLAQLVCGPPVWGAILPGLQLSSFVGGACLSSMMGALTGSIGRLVAVHKENNASEAEVGLVESDRRVAESEHAEKAAKDVAEDSRKDRQRVQDGIVRTRDMVREARDVVREQIGGRSISPTLQSSGKALAQVTNAHLRMALEEKIELAKDTRRAEQDSLALRLEAAELKKEAVEADIAKRERGAWLAFGKALFDIATTVASAGTASAATAGANVATQVKESMSIAEVCLKLSSIGLDTANAAMMDNSEARKLHQGSAQKELQAKQRDRDADAMRAEKKFAKEHFERGLDAAQRIQDAQKYGGDGVMVTNAIGLGEIAKIRALMALEDKKSSRREISEARDQELAVEQAALELRKKSDEEAGAKETRQQIFSAVGAGLSTLALPGCANGVSDSFFKKAFDKTGWTDSLEKVGSVLSSVTRATGSLWELAAGNDVMELQRKADEVRLDAKRAAARISDAEATRDEAQDEMKRTLDAAITMHRNLTPTLA